MSRAIRSLALATIVACLAFASSASAQVSQLITLSVPSQAAGSVTITAATPKIDDLARVEIYIDHRLVRSCPSAQCTYTWSTVLTTDGPHRVSARRVSSSGGIAATGTRVVVLNGDTTPPTVTVEVPATGSRVVAAPVVVGASTTSTTVAQHSTSGPVAAAPMTAHSTAAPPTATTPTTSQTSTPGGHSAATSSTSTSTPATSTGGPAVATATPPMNAPSSTAAGSPAQLPQASVDTTMPDTSRYAVVTLNAGGNLQAALDAASPTPGTVINLQPGATFTGPFTLPAKSGSGWIIVQTNPSGSALPALGARVAPSNATQMAKIVGPGGPFVMAASPGASRYRFIGIEIAPTSGAYVDTLVLFGYEPATLTGVTSLSALPRDIIFDRCYVRGDRVAGAKRGIALNAANAAVVDSYFADIKADGYDTQAVAAWNGPGPFKLVNNYFEAAGENVMFGGADPSIQNLVPSDIEIRANVFTKPLTWNPWDSTTYAGTLYTVKNLFELKNARRVLIDRNVFSNNWIGAQVGFAIQFTPRNQSGTAPWSAVQDITFTNNIVQRTSGGINLLGLDDNFPAQQLQRVLIRNNIFTEVGDARWGGMNPVFQVLSGAAGVVIDHNTALNRSQQSLMADGVPSPGFVFTNNIVTTDIGGSGAGPGTDALNKFFPGAVFTNNVVIGGDSNPTTFPYPPGNFFPPSAANIGFMNAAGGDYRLNTSSPYARAGTDGNDIGALFGQ